MMAIAVDPICKMDVDTDSPPGGQGEYEGTTYYFCAPGCKGAFDREPEKYLAVGDSGVHADHHEHGRGGHSHGHHMPERESEDAPAANRPGFFARLFGKK